MAVISLRVGIAVLPFVFAQSVVAAQSDKSNSSATAASGKHGDSKLICSISVKEPDRQAKQSIEVGVVVKNGTDHQLVESVVPYFMLTPLTVMAEAQRNELTYEALWDVEKGTSLPVSSTSLLDLNPGQARKFSLDIGDLLWSRVNWSVLPHSKLLKVVPAGRYSLHLELAGNGGRSLCSSKSVDVHIIR